MGGRRRQVGIKVNADVRDFNAGMASASKSVRAFVLELGAASNTLFSRANLMQAGIAGAAVATVAALKATVGAAADFEVRMRNVNSIVRASDAEFAAMSKTVLDLASRFPQSAEQVADGLYEIASAGFSGSDATTILEASLRAASAGMTDTNTAATAIVSILRAYGLEASNAAEVSDVLFQTVNLGIVTFEELAQQLGDVVGIAAAAGIEIADVGAAFSAITLAGIQPAEASTSLNRVIQSLIQPSEALVTVFGSMGKSSQDVLETLGQPGGLNEIMEDLREVTGGNVATLLALFPEIRAARGAFALMSAAGENYRRTQEQIGDEQKRAQATQRAFSEQMRATGNRLRVAASDAKAMGIELGNSLLPAVNGVAAGLGGLTDVLRVTIEFLVDNNEVLIVFGAVLAARAIPALATLALNLLATTGLWIAHAAGVRAGSTAYVGLGVSIGAAALQLGAIGLIVGGGLLLKGLNDAKAAADGYVESLKEGLDLATDEGWRDFNDRLREQIELRLQQEQMESQSGPGDFFRTLFDPNFRTRRAELDAMSEAMEQGSIAALNEAHNIDAIAVATGTRGSGTGTAARLAEFAKAAGADLSRELNGSASERQKVIDYMNSLAAETGITIDQLTALGPAMIEQMQKAAEAAEDAGEAFTGVFGLFAGFELPDAEEAAQQAVDAAGRVADAESRLADARERLADESAFINPDAEQQRKIADARRDVADAERELAEARREAEDARRVAEDPEAAITEHAREQVAQAEQFIKDIEALASRGLDPQFLLRAMGDPEQFAPILRSLVEDVDGSLIETVNRTEEHMRELRERFEAEFGLIASAVQGHMDKLPDIVLDGLKAALTSPLSDVRFMANQIGAEILLGVKEGMGADVERSPDAYGPGIEGGGSIKGNRRAYGSIDAHIANTPTILYGERSTGGEAFIPLGAAHRGRSTMLLAEVSRMFGYGLIPMAAGGILGRSLAPSSVSNVSSTTHNWKFGDIRADSLNDIMRQADRKTRLAALGSGV